MLQLTSVSPLPFSAGGGGGGGGGHFAACRRLKITCQASEGYGEKAWGGLTMHTLFAKKISGFKYSISATNIWIGKLF